MYIERNRQRMGRGRTEKGHWMDRGWKTDGQIVDIGRTEHRQRNDEWSEGLRENRVWKEDELIMYRGFTEVGKYKD